jgi:hypothetical protein
MGYRIRMVPEVAGWLGQPRDDRLDAWYAEAIRRSRTRYERDQGGTG